MKSISHRTLDRAVVCVLILDILAAGGGVAIVLARTGAAAT